VSGCGWSWTVSGCGWSWAVSGCGWSWTVSGCGWSWEAEDACYGGGESGQPRRSYRPCCGWNWCVGGDWGSEQRITPAVVLRDVSVLLKEVEEGFGLFWVDFDGRVGCVWPWV
jgi:hypothetical protein